MNERFDAVVVGSGFGGSVMAYRLAQAGRSVCLLERGRPYPPGSFARSPADMAKNFWDPSEGLHGLFDFWSFRGIEGVVSSGLGGGSLIYANVLIRKPAEWFDDEHDSWPIRYEDLESHYEAAEGMLAPQRYPAAHEPYASTPKTVAFAEAAERVFGRRPRFPDLAVTFGTGDGPPVPGEEIPGGDDNLHGAKRYTCRLVAECDIGCNWGAKNTLDFNYLSAAQREGATIRTLSEVRAFERAGEDGWLVRYRRHRPPDEPEQHTLQAGRLILSAGAFGSTFLLLKNRAALSGMTGEHLGTRFSGNGDLLTFATRCKDGSGRARRLDPSVGTVITSALPVPPGEGSGERGFYLEDAGVPEFAGWLLEAADAPNALLRVPRILWKRLKERFTGQPNSNLSAELSALLGKTELSSGTLPLLAMGRDFADGNMSLTKKGYLDLDWKIRKSDAYFRWVRRHSHDVARQLGGKPVDNPIWHLKRVITVHPLGGCPMGAGPGEAVVSHETGEVFGCPGLHVADGSVLPGPVGPNPSLTIAAVSDRFASGILGA
jgi:cholesterol oxidase